MTLIPEAVNESDDKSEINEGGVVGEFKATVFMASKS